MPSQDYDLKPLPARSVVLSLLLGEDRHRMSPAQLARAGEHFGIPAPTVRVALTRGISAGDLAREGNDYVLGERMLVRMRRQDEAVEDATLPWDGSWEMAVIVVTGRAAGRAPRGCLGSACKPPPDSVVRRQPRARLLPRHAHRGRRRDGPTPLGP